MHAGPRRARGARAPNFGKRRASRVTSMAAATSTHADATSPPRYARCYATLLFRDDNMTTMRRVFEEDEAMMQVWTKRMLQTTELPIFFVYIATHALDATIAQLRDIEPASRRGQIQFWPVTEVLGGGISMYPWYRLVHTKLHAWALPCRQVAFLDYDGVALRKLDAVFDACGADEALCACQDRVVTKRAGLRLPNAGMLVLRRNTTAHRLLIAAAADEARRGRQRLYFEQGFLNTKYPRWKELPIGFNLPYYTLKRQQEAQHASVSQTVRNVLNDSSLFFLHQPLRHMPSELASSLGFQQGWKALQKRYVLCHRPGGANVHRRVVVLGTNLTRTADGSLLGC